MVRQNWNILNPVAQRRDVEGNYIEAIEEIFTKIAAADLLLEVLVRRGDHADVYLHRFVRADGLEALFLDDSTIRIWLKEFQEGGVEAIVLFDLKGGTGRLSPLQIDELRAWATEVLPTSTTEIGQFILDRFGFDYGRSGLIKLMNRIGFDWKKPESVPGKIDVETQQEFIDAHEDLRNSLGPDETVVYVDAVHPTHQAKPAGRWLPRGQRCALPAASGRVMVTVAPGTAVVAAFCSTSSASVAVTVAIARKLLIVYPRSAIAGNLPGSSLTLPATRA